MYRKWTILFVVWVFCVVSSNGMPVRSSPRCSSSKDCPKNYMCGDDSYCTKETASQLGESALSYKDLYMPNSYEEELQDYEELYDYSPETLDYLQQWGGDADTRDKFGSYNYDIQAGYEPETDYFNLNEENVNLPSLEREKSEQETLPTDKVDTYDLSFKELPEDLLKENKDGSELSEQEIDYSTLSDEDKAMLDDFDLFQQEQEIDYSSMSDEDKSILDDSDLIQQQEQEMDYSSLSDEDKAILDDSDLFQQQEQEMDFSSLSDEDKSIFDDSHSFKQKEQKVDYSSLSDEDKTILDDSDLFQQQEQEMDFSSLSDEDKSILDDSDSLQQKEQEVDHSSLSDEDKAILDDSELPEENSVDDSDSIDRDDHTSEEVADSVSQHDPEKYSVTEEISSDNADIDNLKPEELSQDDLNEENQPSSNPKKPAVNDVNKMESDKLLQRDYKNELLEKELTKIKEIQKERSLRASMLERELEAIQNEEPKQDKQDKDSSVDNKNSKYTEIDDTLDQDDDNGDFYIDTIVYKPLKIFKQNI